MPKKEDPCERIGNKFKSISFYDTEFGLNYRGEESYKTACGACFTIFIVFFITNVFIIGIKRLYLRNEPERVEHVMLMTEEMYEENGLMELTHHRFNLAFETR